MTSPDMINGGFELLGSIFTWVNVKRVCSDKGYAGIYLPAVVFFASWGCWNIYYYPHLEQWASFVGGLSIALANVAWITAMLVFGRKK